MNVPDRVFALGGAGKEIALTLLEQEWILEHVLEPRPNPEELTVTIIDSASGEENNDIERIQDIRNRRTELQNEFREGDLDGRTGSIDITYKLLTENIQLNSSIDLIGDSAVPRITEGTGMAQDDWWLKEQHINENLDFARGVVRKRGLGKALYYKSYAEDDEIGGVIDLPEKGKIAMIGGLGGGTGSGLMIDIAQHIQDRQPTAEITLFGILPNHFEGIEENTNAYAALSELEYLSLTNENIFKDIMLCPIDPTGFDGKRGQMIQSEEELQRFDEALVYQIMSYYHTDAAGLEDPFQSSPQYAPFTIAIPQILRYNIEAINDARGSVREILDRKRQALEAEQEVYSQVERFLNKHYGTEAGGTLRDLDQTDLTKRIENVESLLSFDLFEELDYHARSIFQEVVEDAEAESSSIGERIDLMDAQARAVDATSHEVGNFVDDLDETLAEIVEQELHLLARRKELFEKRKAIDDSQVRGTIEYLMSTDDDDQVNAGVQLQRLETKLEDIEDRRERLESELEDVTEELEQVKEEQREEIETSVDRWEKEVRGTVDQLQRLDDLTVEDLLEDLRGQLERFANNVAGSQERDAVDRVSENEIIDILDQLERQLDTIGIKFQEERNEIEQSLTDLKQAKTAQLQMSQEEGTFEKLLPWQSSTEEEAETAHKDYKRVQQQINNRNVFSIGPPKTTDISVEVTFNINSLVDEIRDRENELRTSVVSALESQIENSNEKVGELRNALRHESDLDKLVDISRAAFELEILDTEEIRERKEEIEAELEAANSQIEIYESTLDVFDSLKKPRTTYTDNLSEYRQLRNEYDDATGRQVSTESEEYVYVKNIQPNNVFRATGNDSLAESDLFSNEGEARRLQTQLEELAKNTRNQQYTGLRQRTFSKGRSRYNGIKIRVGVASPAISQIDPDTLDFEETFSEAFNLGASGQRIESPYTTWQGDFGGDWDIALTVFIDGVFLDNIRKVVQTNGYRSSYIERESQLGEDILIHHSFGLDKGFYVRRKSILNLEDEDEVAFYLRDNDDEITNELRQHYTDVIEVDNPMPLEESDSETAWSNTE